MIAVHEEVEFSTDYRNIINKNIYEEIVYNIISTPNKFFSDRIFTKVEQQSHGESDFIDQNGVKYEVKLILNKKQGKILGERKNSILEWIRVVIDELNQFKECFHQENMYDKVRETILFSVLEERIKSINEDEIGILFLPFKLGNDYKGMVYGTFATDFLQACYKCLADDGIIGNKELYYIYLGMDGYVVIRNAKNYNRDYIRCEELEKYISFKSAL